MKSIWTPIGALRMHARLAAHLAEPDAPVLVLVHGVGLASPFLVPLAERLAPHTGCSPSTCPASG